METQVVSFPVLFNCYDETTSERDKSSDKIIITLEGTKTQIWGFICMFYGVYGCQAMWDPELDRIKFMRHRWKFCQDDINPGDIAALGERYVIDLPDLEGGYGGIQFCTTNLPEFVSGMYEAPIEIRLKDRVISKPHTIGQYKYLDLFRDELQDLYTQTEEELDPFLGCPTLSEVDVTNVPPLIFRYEVE